MGIYRQFPYTNFHDLNLDWFLSHFNEIMSEWETFKNEINNKVDELIDFKEWFEQWTSAEIDNAVWEWLTEHPEAITMNWFVTPQMYGAVGNGTHDDTNAFIMAFNSGKQVIVPNGNYRLSETLVTDESILYIDRGSYTDEKIVCSKSLTEGTINAYNLENKSLVDYRLVGVQGACYNSDHNSIIYGSDANTEDNNSILVEIGIVSGEILSYMKNNQFGHINDITYNPNTRKYYMTYGEGNDIVIVNEFLVFEEKRYISGVVGLIAQISYDIDSNVFIINTVADGLYILDDSLTVIKRVSTNSSGANNYPYENIADEYPQGSTIYNGQFISIYWLWGRDGFPSYARLIQYNYLTGEIKQINDVVYEYGNEEPEALYTIGDDVYIVGYYGTTLTTAKLNYNHDNFVIRNGNKTIDLVLQSTSHNGMTLDNMKMIGQNGLYFIEGWLKNRGETVTEGTSVAMYLAGISHMYGIAQGWTGNTLIAAAIEENNIAFRPLNGDFPATWDCYIRGFVKII